MFNERSRKFEKAGVHVHKSANVSAPVQSEYPIILEREVESCDDETGNGVRARFAALSQIEINSKYKEVGCIKL